MIRCFLLFCIGCTLLDYSDQIASGAVPVVSRQDILSYGQTAIGCPYVWNGASWNPEDPTWEGADCSGYVVKCWSLTRWTPFTVRHYPYATRHFIETPGPYWYEVDRSDLIYGDAIIYTYDGGAHTYLYLSDDGWGEHEVYEARSSAYGIVHRWRSVNPAANRIKGIRRTSLLDVVGNTEHIVETDDGSPWYTDSGMTGDTTLDSHALGCSPGQSRYRIMTPYVSDTCTFRANLPEAGWYRIYVSVTENTQNVHDVGVTIDTGTTSERFLWDQGNDEELDQWHLVADQSFWFEAGSGGTVVWDNLQAWPKTFSYAFLADATKWVLDNRVIVDGIGAEPGHFATLSDAIDWLHAHESEEPDIIQVTCDKVFEPGCVYIDLPDNVTIEGDADHNGIPVTIVVPPSAPADWSRQCGMYLDIPMQKTYTLRNLTLIPEFVSAGFATGAYGLVIDENNPASDACAWTLNLESVTIAGSLPGNTATGQYFDNRAAATLFGSSELVTGAAVLQRTSEDAGDATWQRQHVHASELTVTHSATRGICLQSAHTTWLLEDIYVSWCDAEGIRLDNLSDTTVAIGSDEHAGGYIVNNESSGVHIRSSEASQEAIQINRCVIRNNKTTGNGAGITALESAFMVNNCILDHNTATGVGGAIFTQGSSFIVSHSTLVDNTALRGGAVGSSESTGTIANSILWNNVPEDSIGDSTIRWSATQYAEGENVTHRNPLFQSEESTDYHLQPGSPCINAGNSSFMHSDVDMNGNARVQCGKPDLGPFESPLWNGDGDHDGDVDSDDSASLAQCLLESGPLSSFSHEACGSFDFDQDGDIDLRDVSRFQIRWDVPESTRNDPISIHQHSSPVNKTTSQARKACEVGT